MAAARNGGNRFCESVDEVRGEPPRTSSPSGDGRPCVEHFIHGEKLRAKDVSLAGATVFHRQFVPARHVMRGDKLESAGHIKAHSSVCVVEEGAANPGR